MHLTFYLRKEIDLELINFLSKTQEFMRHFLSEYIQTMRNHVHYLQFLAFVKQIAIAGNACDLKN